MTECCIYFGFKKDLSEEHLSTELNTAGTDYLNVEGKHISAEKGKHKAMRTSGLTLPSGRNHVMHKNHQPLAGTTYPEEAKT